MIVRLAGVASRDRVAVWRQLRKIGAAPLSQGVWIVPETPYFTDAIRRVDELARRGSGDVLVVSAKGTTSAGGEALDDAFRSLRVDEWAEFERDCSKFEAGLDKGTRNNKFTLAELEEKEQSLDRLRRWYHDLKKRDALELPEAVAAEGHFHQCGQLFDDYANRVYSGLHADDGHPAADSTGIRKTREHKQ